MRSRYVLMFSVLLLLLSATLEGQGRFRDSARELFRGSGALACTVVAGPVDAGPDSLESDVLCLDSAISLRVLWVRFAAGDRDRVNRNVGLGSRLRIKTASGVIVGGEPVMQADAWRAKDPEDGAVAFLASEEGRLPLLAWTLRDRVDTARHFRINFADLAEDLSAVNALLTALGESTGIVDDAEAGEDTLISSPPPLDPTLLACRDTLRQMSAGLAALEARASAIPDEHHGPMLDSIRGMGGLIQGFFLGHPLEF